MKCKLIFTLLALAVAPLAQAEMYKWVDAKGTVHYSQSRPVKGKYQAVTPKVSPPTANPNLDAMRKPAEEPAKQAPVQTASAGDAAQRQQTCTQARARLDFLSQTIANRMFTPLPDGSNERWTDEKYQAEVSQAQQAADKNC